MNPQAFQPTPEQQAVIGHEGSAFVTACPGAGKTRVMTERARRLFSDMPAGRGVAFLSFTQGAIFELETRLQEERILPSPVFPSFIGTFDSFVWQFLVAPFGVKDCDARPRLIADLADLAVTPFRGAHPLPLSCFCPVTGNIFEQAAKVRGFDVSQKPAHLVQAYVTAAAAIRARLRERGQLGFDEARGVALERLKDAGAAPRIAAALVGRFREVIVDEAQDCNPDDLHVISWLRDSGLPVKVVCDPHQSIYEFRGGVTDQLFTFAETFGEGNRKTLTGNFRSAPNVCKSIAQLRPPASRMAPDEPLGPYKDDATPIRILSYPGTAVPASIGAAFCAYVKEADIDPALSPLIAATRASGAAAAGQPRPSNRRDRAVRLAEAVTDFYFAAGFNDMKSAIDQVHQILLELEGRLGDLSYRQYLADNEIEQANWRPHVLFLLRALRFDPSKHADAKAWHAAAKDLLAQHLTLGDGPSLSQRLKWNDAVAAALAAVPAATAMPRTIHAVKGMEFPAVCVVTTASTLKSILDYLETGEPADKAEDARKLYVASSRAEKLLVIAAPKSQADRLATYLRGQGAAVEVKEI
ncbi:MAG: UvrD-helicase domain-containing protein [Rhodospirillales bacterium]|nr:UvrD-helicase domain-containing protein [Rhodospirillales bacterium]